MNTEYAREFSEDFGFVVQGEQKLYIDKIGNVIGTFRADEGSSDFSEGLAAVQVDDKWGFMNTSAKMAIVPKFDSVGDFSEGLARVELEGQYWFIDQTGKAITQPRVPIDSGCEDWEFHNGRAAVQVDGKCAFIDRSDAVILRTETNPVKGVREFSEGMQIIENGSRKCGYFRADGVVVITPQFDYCTDFLLPNKAQRLLSTDF